MPPAAFRGAGDPRTHYLEFMNWLATQSEQQIRNKRAEADLNFRRVGITFAVYGAKDEPGVDAERPIPFDMIPRIIPGDEWRALERGLRQRVQRAQPLHPRRLSRPGHHPRRHHSRRAGPRTTRSTGRRCRASTCVRDIYAHIAGVDIVRAGQGEFYVLEDNLRVPSGVSYMLENRKMMMRLFPELFARNRVAPVAHYPDLLLDTLRAVAPEGVDDPVIVVLTPGMYNSAYFEHAFLAQQMGVELVEGQDLFVDNDHVYMRTTQGPQRVDVIYRRLDDDFLDPLVVPRGFDARRAGPDRGVSRGQRVARATRSAPASPTTSRSIRTCPT